MIPMKRKYYVPSKSSNSTITKNLNSTLLSQDQLSIQFRTRSRPLTGVPRTHQQSSTIDYLNDSSRVQTTQQAKRQRSERQLSHHSTAKPIVPSHKSAFLAYFTSNVSHILDHISHAKHSLLYPKLTRLIELSLHTLDIRTLGTTLFMASKILFLLGDYHRALFLFNQVRIVATYAEDLLDHFRIQALIFIGKCAQRMNQYHTSVVIIKKGIQYAWYQHDNAKEIQLYNLLSMSYFYLGELEKCNYFQERSLLGDYECENSPIRQLSNTFLKFQLEKNKKALLNKLNLPIQDNILTNALREEGEEFDGISRMLCQGSEVLESIVRSPEYDFQIYTPRNSVSSQASYYEQIRNDKHLQAQFRDKRMLKMDMSSIGVIQQKSKATKLDLDPRKYKLDLDKKIQLRKNLDFSYDQVIDRCNKRVSNNLNYRSQLRNKIMVNHLKKGRGDIRKSEINQAMKCVVETLAKFNE